MPRPGSGSDPSSGSDPVETHLLAIRADLSQLQQSLNELRGLVQDLVQERGSGEAIQRRPTSSPTKTLARRHPERLAAEVQRRTALLTGEDLDPMDGDTELDLLIDRLHDLALEGL